MHLSDEEVPLLREYLLRGGFLVVDDFHGTREWQNFYHQIKRVLPEYEPFDLPIDHPIFHCYYDIDQLFQVPGLQYIYSGRTWERDGYKARYMGIEDEDGRLMVMINHNVDLEMPGNGRAGDLSAPVRGFGLSPGALTTSSIP